MGGAQLADRVHRSARVDAAGEGEALGCRFDHLEGVRRGAVEVEVEDRPLDPVRVHFLQEL